MDAKLSSAISRVNEGIKSLCLVPNPVELDSSHPVAPLKVTLVVDGVSAAEIVLHELRVCSRGVSLLVQSTAGC